MKLNHLIKNFGFFLGFVFFTFTVGCSSKILSENQTNISPTPSTTSENCEIFAGEWISHTFENINDESQMICDGRPCTDRKKNSEDLRIICTNGKITGEKILAWSTEGIISNIAVPNKTPFVPQEMTVPLKDGKVENGILQFSYTFDGIADTDCLREINLKPKGGLLVGNYKTSGCVYKKTNLSKMTEDRMRVKLNQGGIVLERSSSE